MLVCCLMSFCLQRYAKNAILQGMSAQMKLYLHYFGTF